MENINLLSTTGYYAFNDGDILHGSAMQGVRDKINELIRAFNAQFGSGDNPSSGGEGGSGSGDNSGSGDGASAPYMYMASRMLGFDETPGQINYSGEIYTPVSQDAYIDAEVDLYTRTAAWADEYWRIHDDRNVCVMRGRNTIVDNNGKYVHSIYSYQGNPNMYENPGKWLGNKYVFSASTQIQDSLYGIQCFLKNDTGWITNDDNVNNVVIENVPSKYQILKDPDLYNINIQGNPMLWRDSSGDLYLNYATQVKGKFTYGGSRCVNRANPEVTPTGYNRKLRVTGTEGNVVTDTMYGTVYHGVAAQHDPALNLAIGVIRGSDWVDAETSIPDAFLNDYDPRVRYIWQLHNRGVLSEVVYYLLNGVGFSSYSDDYVEATDFEKSLQSLKGYTINGQGKIKVTDLIADYALELILNYIGPKMPWENSENSDWEVTKKYNEDNKFYTINFEGDNWRDKSNRSDLKSSIVGENRHSIRSAVQTAIRPILTRQYSNAVDRGYEVSAWEYAYNNDYQEITQQQWASKISNPALTYTIEKFYYFIYYKDGSNYKVVYTVKDGSDIKYFIIDDPAAANELTFESNGDVSTVWKNNIIAYKDADANGNVGGNKVVTWLTRQDILDNCYVKRFFANEDGKLKDSNWEDFDPTNMWEDVEGEDFKVLKFSNSSQIGTEQAPGLPWSTKNDDVSIFAWSYFGNGVSHPLPRMYGFIVKGINDKVSVGIIAGGNNSTYTNPATESYMGVSYQLDDAAYSWEYLIERAISGLGITTRPTSMDQTNWLWDKFILDLKKLSIRYYDENPNSSLSESDKISRYSGMFTTAPYVWNNIESTQKTLRASIKNTAEDDIMPRLSKQYGTTDWYSWIDLKECTLVEGPCTEGQGSFDGSKYNYVFDAPSMTLYPGDKLILLRNTATRNSASCADVYFNEISPDQPFVFSAGIAQDPFSNTQLSSLFQNMQQIDNFTLPNLETISDWTTSSDTHGRFGGEFIVGIFEAINKVTIARMILDSFYYYGYNTPMPGTNQYTNAKINYRGYNLEPVSTKLGLY